MGVGELGGGVSNIARAEDSDDDEVVSTSKAQSGSGAPSRATYWTDKANDQLDAILGFLSEVEVEVGEDVTSYSGLTPDGAQVDIDFGIIDFSGMNVDMDVDCSATCSGHTASAPVCGVAKIDGRRTFMFLIHEFPEGNSQGKGCFRTVSDLSERDTELALITGEEDFLVNGAYDIQSANERELEIFFNTDVADLDGNRVKNAHARIVKTYNDDAEAVVTTLSLEGTTSEFGDDADLHFRGAWIPGSDRLKTALEVEGTTIEESCVTFDGTAAEGCVDVDLPVLIAAAEDEDITISRDIATSSGVVGGGLGVGDRFTIVIDATAGTGLAWGRNFDGQFGNNDDADSSVPVVIPDIENVEMFSGGNRHSLAVIPDPETGVKYAWGWGENLFGQLGDGTSGNRRDTPVRVDSLSNVVFVEAGTGNSFFRLEDGTVYAVGANGGAALGDGTTTNRTSPVRVQGDMTNVIDIVSAGGHVMALRSDGTAFGWGTNVSGQLGVDSEEAQSTPVELPFENAVALAGTSTSSFALLDDGTVEGIGSDYLGDGRMSVDVLDPVAVSDLTDVVAIDGGTSFMVALKADGTVWSWGANSGFESEGMLGDGTTTDRTTPVQVSGLTDIVAVGAGWNHGVAVRRDGTVWAWGTNAHGQLGDGTTTNRLTPVQVQGIEDAE